METEVFEKLLRADKESEHLEFKTAKTNFNLIKGSHSLCGYFAALANEKGGRIILGVKDKIPREVSGTSIEMEKLKEVILDKFSRRANIEEFFYNKKRTLIINVPSRPIGDWIMHEGRALMRIGERLENMTQDMQKEIVNEAFSDYSSKLIDDANISDLSFDAIKELRTLLTNSERVEKDISSFNDEQLLVDLGLIQQKKITLAALVLLGKENSLKRFLPHAEIRFGYRSEEYEIRNDDTKIFAEGYLLFYNKLWDKIDSRNITLRIVHGLKLLEKKAFEEETLREAINNAIIHRDYSKNGTILMVQNPKNFEVSSPGGLLGGITIENMIDETKTRNKLIADVLFKCDFVEQFGNGVNLMVKNQLSSGKNVPDYSKTTDDKVVLRIDGTIQDAEFARYVYLAAMKKGTSLDDKELLMLNRIKLNQKVEFNDRIDNLLHLGLIESPSRGKYILSKQYYRKIGRKGEYTRKRGLDKEKNKLLILNHLNKWGKGYMSEFRDVFGGDIPKSRINSYLEELKREGKIELIGDPKAVRGLTAAYWRTK